MKALAAGGAANHVHMLLSAPATMALSKALQLVKGGSSHWMKESFPNVSAFAWQDGYGAFTVSESQLGVIGAYIEQTVGTSPHKDIRRRVSRTHRSPPDRV